MTDLTCMHRLADAPHTILLGGDQSKIVQLDLETQKEARIVSSFFLKDFVCYGYSAFNNVHALIRYLNDSARYYWIMLNI